MMSQDTWTAPPVDGITPAAPTSEGQKPSLHFVIGALLIPILGMVAVLWAETFIQGIIIGLAMVVISSLLVYLDARQLGNLARNGKKLTNPIVMLMGSLILWIIFYPWSFVRRNRITGPNLSLIAVLVAALFVGGPFLYTYLVPPGLPACDSTEVKQVIAQLVRQMPVGATVTRIDGYQQLNYDSAKDQRTGQCLLHTPQGDVTLKYIVEWRGQDHSQFQVRSFSELPSCASPEAKQLLEQVVRGLKLGQGLQSIADYRELSYDAQKEERQCQCTLTTATDKVIIKYVINWQDKQKGMFQVLVLSPDGGT